MAQSFVAASFSMEPNIHVLVFFFFLAMMSQKNQKEQWGGVLQEDLY